MRILIIIIAFTISSLQGHAQEFKTYNGFSLGLSFSFGNKYNRLGLHFSEYLAHGFIQGNAALNAYWNIRTLGVRESGFELQFGMGLELGFGREDTVRNEFIGLGEHNMTHLYGAGYSYMRYWDTQGTSQSAGMFDLNIADFRLMVENDLFGGGQGWRDMFRTGALSVDYQYENFRFGLSTVMWTGDYVGCNINHTKELKARHGYREQAGSKFGDRSAGLFSAQVQYLTPYNQMPRINVGVDSEHVRNFFQNRLIHNAGWKKTEKIKYPQPVIPMLQTDGSQYLNRDGQEVRPASFYFNFGLNNFPFY